MSIQTVTARFQVSEVKHLQSLTHIEHEPVEKDGIMHTHREQVFDDNGHPVLSTYGVEVSMYPVYTPDPKSENYIFANTTPTGSMMMKVVNPALLDWFYPGMTLDIQMTVHKPQ